MRPPEKPIYKEVHVCIRKNLIDYKTCDETKDKTVNLIYTTFVKGVPTDIPIWKMTQSLPLNRGSIFQEVYENNWLAVNDSVIHLRFNLTIMFEKPPWKFTLYIMYRE